MEDVMKTFLAILALAGVVVSVPAYAEKICLDTRKMVSSESKDGRTMVFKMRDGTTFVNRLRGYCPDLKFTGFAWTLQAGDTRVCENENSFQVLQSLQTCTLGKFDAPLAEKQTVN
jgi:hypothetical protein